MSLNSPIVYAVGDIQGCDNTLAALLDKIYQHHDTHHSNRTLQLWFAGDLINRGPKSLAVLRRLYQLEKKTPIQIVLGNHDLHTLKVAAGVGKHYDDDTIDDILNAPDREELLHWLRYQPLAHKEVIDQQAYLMVHAGTYPQWSVNDILTYAREIEQSIQSADWVEFMRELYGTTPMSWTESLTGMERARCIVNALTRIRFCRLDKSLDFSTKSHIAPEGSMPWFDHPERQTQDHTLIFGHWSAMGLVVRPNLLGLDTGCIWGGALTAVCLATREILQENNLDITLRFKHS